MKTGTSENVFTATKVETHRFSVREMKTEPAEQVQTLFLISLVTSFPGCLSLSEIKSLFC